MYVIVTYMNLK